MQRKTPNLKLSLGEEAPYFSLPGTDGKIYSLSDVSNSAGFVALFTCNHCPYVKAYEERFINLAREFQRKGIKFIAICSNDSDGYPEDSLEKMKERALELDLPYPYLRDKTQQVAKAYDAACTPEVYLFDKDKKLAYHGTIDDNYKDPEEVTKQYLREALEAVATGKTPETQLTQAIGCSIKWKN